MNKTFRSWQSEQTTMLPASRREWLSEDQKDYLLLVLVDELDHSTILIQAQTRDPRGEKGVCPADVGEAFRAAVDDAAALRLMRGHGLRPKFRRGLLRGTGFPDVNRKPTCC